MSQIIQEKDNITIVECKWNKSGQEMERLEVSVQCEDAVDGMRILKEVILEPPDMCREVRRNMKEKGYYTPKELQNHQKI